ncbi:MAG: cation diffusion facilitator family transporter, partial [Candidatus Nezhaarchaeota archaeon]|nr:cation diffusion facilitator family transporter [Candidatus Nezhaarchaeota archaeon]
MRANLGKFKALKVSALATISVVAVEVVLGLLVGSLAILSDGAHALLDAVATLVLLAAAKVSMKPPDEEHTYGHEKLEPLGGFVGGLILLGAAGLLAVEAASRLARGGVCIAPGWEPLGFAAVAYALSIEALRVWVLRIAEGGATVKAGLYHALADLGSTLVALLGFGLATLGLHYFDPLASLALCAAVAYMSLRLAWASGMELIDAAPRGVVEEVRRRVA